MSDENFISRWSRRKIQARAEAPVADAPGAANSGQPAAAPLASSGPASVAGAPAPAPLPALESLTPESDFSPFMRADVDPLLRREALKTLFHDPRHNIQDGLDTYIADYSIADPLPEGWLEKMNQVKHLGDYHPPEEAVAAIEAQGAPVPVAATDAPPAPASPAALEANDESLAPAQPAGNAPADTAGTAATAPPVNES